jgi:SAM-dependent methyltransferase
LDRTREPNTLNALIRLFWLGRAVPSELALECLNEELLEQLLEVGLLHQESESLRADVFLLPVDGFLVAADHPSSFERAESDLVLWPNPTSKFLGKFTIRRSSRATLDLGTGSGILSLWASGHSEKVVATDLNPRASLFASFNARLNGVENIEALTGDGFVPVSGRSFDLILSNPPFFISPRSEYLFCDNPMELDFLCRKIVREASEHLNEGGYLQMLCEWAQIRGQAWEERVAEWLEGTGCDAWVMKGLTQGPEEYAQQRIRETTIDPRLDTELYDGYMRYYRDRGVEAIHDGLIVMRKRSGANWVRIEEVPKTPSGDLGEIVAATFAAHDFLREVADDKPLLEIRPKLAEHVRLEQICQQSADQWRAESLTLRLISGFPFYMPIQPMVAQFLVGCDGEHTSRQVIESFAAAGQAPFETVERECLAMLRKLIERGFLVVVPDPDV